MSSVPDDLATWRKQQRATLLARRDGADAATRLVWSKAIDAHLQHGFPGLSRGTLGFCWPHGSEHDARHIAASMRGHGAVTALPVVVKPRAPLVFREWHPGVKLQPGPLGIPFPPESVEVDLDTALVPMVG